MRRMMVIIVTAALLATSAINPIKALAQKSNNDTRPFSDIRYWRTGLGSEVAAPALVKRGQFFPIRIAPGAAKITRLFFITQGGHWSPHFPSSYEAENLDISLAERALTHDYVSQYDYHRWELAQIPQGQFTLAVKIGKSGRVLLTMEIERPDGVKETERFVIDCH